MCVGGLQSPEKRPYDVCRERYRLWRLSWAISICGASLSYRIEVIMRHRGRGGGGAARAETLPLLCIFFLEWRVSWLDFFLALPFMLHWSLTLLQQFDSKRFGTRADIFWQAFLVRDARYGELGTTMCFTPCYLQSVAVSQIRHFVFPVVH